METIKIIAHTKDASQIEAIKAFMKALKIKFDITKDKPYDQEFVQQILDGDDDFKKGDFKVIKRQDLWK